MFTPLTKRQLGPRVFLPGMVPIHKKGKDALVAGSKTSKANDREVGEKRFKSKISFYQNST